MTDVKTKTNKWDSLENGPLALAVHNPAIEYGQMDTYVADVGRFDVEEIPRQNHPVRPLAACDRSADVRPPVGLAGETSCKESGARGHRKTRRRQPTPDINNLCLMWPADEFPDLVVAADCHNVTTAAGDRLRPGHGGIHREDATVHDDQVCDQRTH